MKLKSGIPLFIKIAIGYVLAIFIYSGLIQRGLLSPPKTPMAEAEGQQILMWVIGSLQAYHIEYLIFPTDETLRELYPYPSRLDYHSVEINLINNSTVVFQIVPKIPDLYAFSGMFMYDEETRVYRVILCQSEKPSQPINFPEIISQCPPNTRIFE